MDCLVALSGGVDSSVTALLLKRGGYNVSGLTLLLSGTDNKAAKAAAALGIPLTVLDWRDRFERGVVSPFAAEYLRGRTPNPCVNCNKAVKFAALCENTDGAFATGHYANAVFSGNRYLLTKAKDLSKDQSYVLYNLTQEQLSRVRFPLGELKKTEVRDIAASEFGFFERDSQDLCFVPDDNYAAVVERYKKVPEGDFLDESGAVIGKHKGFIHYTYGQRRGLGTGFGERSYVIGIDAERNTVTLGKTAYAKTVTASALNLIACDSLPPKLTVTAKVRYNGSETECDIYPCGDGITVQFKEPKGLVSPGQSIVFYDGDVCIGGAVINSFK